MNFQATIKKDDKGYNQLDFEYKGEVKLFLSRLKENKKYIVSIKEKGKQRTTQQNNALHLYFQMLADALNEAGLDQRKVLKPSVDISWDTQSIKNYIWRPIQQALLHKTSTTKLKTDEIDKVYEHLNRHLGEKFGLENIPFPNEEDILIN